MLTSTKRLVSAFAVTVAMALSVGAPGAAADADTGTVIAREDSGWGGR